MLSLFFVHILLINSDNQKSADNRCCCEIYTMLIFFKRYAKRCKLYLPFESNVFIYFGNKYKIHCIDIHYFYFIV